MSRARGQLPDARDQAVAVDARHRDVAHEDVDVVLPQDGQRLVRRPRDARVGAMLGEDERD